MTATIKQAPHLKPFAAPNEADKAGREQLVEVAVRRTLDDCREIASLTTPALSIPFFCILLHALREERHFALVDGFAFPTIGSLVIRFRSEVSIRPMHLFDPQLRS